jgi:phosphatidylglycerophosphatase A
VAAASGLPLGAPRPLLGEDPDPGWVAIDEVAGALLAVTALSGGAWAVAWVIARLADIYKVLPGVGAAERLPGSVGVTVDDLVAGAYGLAAGWLTVLIF